MRIAGVFLGVTLLSFLQVCPAWAQVGQPDAEGFISVLPERMRPESSDGISTLVVSGDPNEPGIYVIRVRFAPGANSPPHTHSQDRYVTVMRGTFWVALGTDAEVYDPDKMVPMPTGSFVMHPAGAIHYDGARDEEVIVQIIGTGPLE